MVNPSIRIDLSEQLKNSYRKFKTSIYYNNYDAILRQQLANFEYEKFKKQDKLKKDIDFSTEKFESYFIELADSLINEDKFNELQDEILNEIDVYVFPKKTKDQNLPKNIIRNHNYPTTEIEKVHYFIDLPIKGHILGFLWILRCGFLLDDNLYKNCFGNRISNSFLNELKNTEDHSEWYDKCTPFLFEPYFKNYEKWRDEGLNSAENLLDSGKNAIMLSLDFKDYYYSSLIDFENLKKDIDKLKKNLKPNKRFNKKHEEIDNRLTKFIKNVFEKYSKKFERDGELPMIPLGFAPSLIISNWNLQEFDQAILEEVRPHYYGRYVDDILIVLESHERSEANKPQEIDILEIEDILEKFFTNNEEYPKNRIFHPLNDSNTENNSENEDKIDPSNENQKIYGVMDLSSLKGENYNKSYCYKNLRIQSEKLKMYTFSNKHSKAILKNFRKEIYKNSSEFQLMHDRDSLISSLEDNIHKIDYYESINKLSDIKDIRINKYEISKELSRINQTFLLLSKLENSVIDEIIYAFKENLFDYVILWEKIFTTLFLNKNYDELLNFIKEIFDLINYLKFEITNENNYRLSNNCDLKYLRNTLKKFLYSSLVRTISLRLDKNVEKLRYYLNNNYSITIGHHHNVGDINKDVESILFALLYNNLYMRHPIQNIIPLLNTEYDEYDLFNERYDYETKNNKVESYEDSDSELRHLINGIYPRYIKLHEIILNDIDKSIYNDLNDIKNNNCLNSSFEKDILKDYYRLNFHMTKNEDSQQNKNSSKNKYSSESNYPLTKYIKFKCKPNEECLIENRCNNNISFEKIIINNQINKESIKVGLLNTKLNEDYYKYKLKGESTLSKERLKNLVDIINKASKSDVELLLMPEIYLPHEWINEIVKMSKIHQIGMIFGVEPYVGKEKVGNYIMMTFPFKVSDNYNETIVLHRLKNNYAPKELQKITTYSKKQLTKDNTKYYYCIWNGIGIAPYYCYEIADIEARSLFKGCCDIVTVSEFNMDTLYFDNIAESLSRDLFCYCIKSNTSDYGGSEIIQPTSSESKILVKLKGGEEDYLVTYDLNIKELKEHKMKSDLIPNNENRFKPKPPGFKYCDNKK